MALTPLRTCWDPVLGGSATGAALLLAAALLPSARGPVAVVAVAALAAAAAFALDEPAASVVDATPATLRWRTLSRLPLLLPPLGVGMLGLTALRSAGAVGAAAPLDVSLWVLLAFTAAACARARTGGTGTPGEPVAIAVAVAVIGLGLRNPWHRWLPVLAVDPASDAATVRAVAVAVPVLLATLGLATGERRWGARGSRALPPRRQGA